MILPQALFNGEKKGFSEIFAEQQAKNRAEKEAVVKDLNARISARDIYAPYQAEADKILTNAISTLPDELRVNPRAITDAVSQYTKYQSYSDKLKEFAQSAETSYKADNEVDTQTALAALRKKYAADGSLDKLEEIVNGGAEEDQVMVNRLKNIGTSITDIINQPGGLEKLGRYYYGKTTEQIKSAVSNAVQVDPSGRPIVRSVQDLDQLGINDALLGDDRVKALVDRRLEGKNVPITLDAQKAELRNMLQPYVSANVAKSTKQDVIDNPAYKENIERSRLSLEREKMNREGGNADQNGNLLANFTTVNLDTRGDQFKNGHLVSTPTAAFIFKTPEFVKDLQGQVLDKSGNPMKTVDPKTGNPIPIDESKAMRAKSPAGNYFFGYNDDFRGKESERYIFGRTMIDKAGNRYLESYLKDPDTKMVSDKPQFLPLEAGLLEGTLSDSKDRSTYQATMNQRGFYMRQQTHRKDAPYQSFDEKTGITAPQSTNPFAPKNLDLKK
jgi:hypothetical protein